MQKVQQSDRGQDSATDSGDGHCITLFSLSEVKYIQRWTIYMKYKYIYVHNKDL